MGLGGSSTNPTTLTLLAGDIGATNSRISLYRAEGRTANSRLERLHFEVFPSQNRSSLQEILREFLEQHSVSRVDLACFGIPGPVKGDTAITTNLPWQVRGSEIERALKIRKVWLLNDLEAIAHGLLHLDDPDFHPLNPIPLPGEGGNLAVLAPGSGLGEAGIYWDGERYHPFGSEGGHSAFAPANALQIELLEYLLKKYARVSWERLLSGPGLVHIYSFLRDTGKASEPAWLHAELTAGNPPKVITAHALDDSSELCGKTVDLFVELLAAEAASLALKLMATGGVYIAGGIVPKILPRVQAGHFQEVFTRQGRLAKVLEAIPVRVVVNDEVGIIGSARYALANTPDHAETPVGFQTLADTEDENHDGAESNA